MPSRASTSLLHEMIYENSLAVKSKCQCPHGLVPHCYKVLMKTAAEQYEDVSMPSRASTSLLQGNRNTRNESLFGCQCPHGLVPHCYDDWNKCLDGYINLVSMPSRASTSLLQYPFKNLGFMRFTEPVFAGIYQNILTAAVFRAC